MKLSQLINSKEPLEKLLKNSLPIKVAWELKKFTKEVNSEFATYDELRVQKVIEMGVESKEVKGTYNVKPENLEAFAKEISELLDKDVEIQVPQIKIGDLLEYKDVNGKGIDITASELMLLDWLIVE